MDKNYALSIPNANDFNIYVNTALENKEINKNEWHEINSIYFTSLYLSTDNPRAQSGHGGDEFHYTFAHLPIMEAIYKNGTFLDIGCANGYLMEMLYKWGNAIGFDLQMYGVEISEGLLELAKNRLPQWHDRFYLGNAFYWKPEHKFDYIIECAEIPEDDKRNYYEHLMENYLVDGGRMIIRPYWYKNEDLNEKRIVEYIGMSPTGYMEKTHYNNPNLIRKLLWFDKI